MNLWLRLDMVVGIASWPNEESRQRHQIQKHPSRLHSLDQSFRWSLNGHLVKPRGELKVFSMLFNKRNALQNAPSADEGTFQRNRT